MVRAWAQLDELEKDSGVSFLREPDLRFAWAAFQRAGGARLEDVLESTAVSPVISSARRSSSLTCWARSRALRYPARPGTTCGPSPAPQLTVCGAASSPTRRSRTDRGFRFPRGRSPAATARSSRPWKAPAVLDLDPPSAQACSPRTRCGPDMAQNALTLWAAGRGEPARTSTVIEDVLGRPALTFAQWAADHTDEFR